MLDHQVVGDLKSEPNRDRRLLGRDHDGVADRLDDLPLARRNELRDGAAEAGRDVGRLLVAVRLGQSRVAGDVREEEGPVDALTLGPRLWSWAYSS
jgi:hypothetical protein